ncbi:MAG TPA: hypothetical protein VJH06_03520 [Candidatus Paceibacterota bacterium]
MIDEAIFKKHLLFRLNKTSVGWLDGDMENGNTKKADIVNHAVKVAIEIKDDTNYKTVFPKEEGVIYTASHDLTKMNQRYADHIKSANDKFKNYPGHKTILIFRTDFVITEVIKYAIEGLHQFKKVEEDLTYAGRKGKYSTYIRNNIGCFVIIVKDKVDFFPNAYADESRVLNKKEVETILGFKIKEI